MPVVARKGLAVAPPVVRRDGALGVASELVQALAQVGSGPEDRLHRVQRVDAHFLGRGRHELHQAHSARRAGQFATDDVRAEPAFSVGDAFQDGRVHTVFGSCCIEQVVHVGRHGAAGARGWRWAEIDQRARRFFVGQRAQVHPAGGHLEQVHRAAPVLARQASARDFGDPAGLRTTAVGLGALVVAPGS